MRARATVFILTILASAVPLAAATPEPLLVLDLDLSERALVVFVDGQHAGRFDVAIGTSRHPTPRGDYTIERVIWNPWWAPPQSEWAEGKQPKPPGHPNNPMQAVKIPFRPLYYIHGTDKPESIGSAASHGCIRMRPEEAVELAKIIMWYTGDDREPDWYHEVLESSRTSEVPLSSTVGLVIRD